MGINRIITTILVIPLLAVTGCATRTAEAGGDTGDPGGDDSSVSVDGSSTTDSPGRTDASVSPRPGATDPRTLPDATPPVTTQPSPIGAVPGTRARIARWKAAGSTEGGRVLLLDATVGGPPCDVVTAVDKAETSASVTIIVYAGVPTGSSCAPGTPAKTGTTRIAVRLAEPLGSRSIVDGAPGR